MEIKDLFQASAERGASDLILTVGAPPVLRIDKDIVQTNMESLKADKIEELIFSILSANQKEELKSNRELNFSHSVSGLARFRTNIFYQRNSLCGVFRRIPFQIPLLKDLNLPIKPIKHLINLHNGLVIISGAVGSGKSTTLAAMIEIINNQKKSHIITIEDPIEYLFKHKKSIIEQREVFSDTKSFPQALRNVMRQNPDVVFIGEMRDAETVQTALTAAETGILVFTTLHTSTASEAVNRIIDFFPSGNQHQIRSQLSSTLGGVISQRLLPKAREKGLIPASEILINQPNISALIRENNIHQIRSIIETSAKKGMESMDQSLLRLYQQKLISKEQLVANIADKERDEVKNLTVEDHFNTLD